MAFPLTAISLHVETEQFHVGHPRNEFRREGPSIEMTRNDGHAFLIHEFSNPVSEKPLLVSQK